MDAEHGEYGVGGRAVCTAASERREGEHEYGVLVWTCYGRGYPAAGVADVD